MSASNIFGKLPSKYIKKPIKTYKKKKTGGDLLLPSTPISGDQPNMLPSTPIREFTHPQFKMREKIKRFKRVKRVEQINKRIGKNTLWLFTLIAISIFIMIATIYVGAVIYEKRFQSNSASLLYYVTTAEIPNNQIVMTTVQELSEGVEILDKNNRIIDKSTGLKDKTIFAIAEDINPNTVVELILGQKVTKVPNTLIIKKQDKSAKYDYFAKYGEYPDNDFDKCVLACNESNSCKTVNFTKKGKCYTFNKKYDEKTNKIVGDKDIYRQVGSTVISFNDK